MTPEDRDAYLRRIGLPEIGSATPETLRHLQSAHLGAIPFEGIDPYLGQTPPVEPQAIADKVLRQGRGGYCFELNTLYRDLLTSAGFAPRRVMARVRQGGGPPGARTHLALLVPLGAETWLTDVGFGSTTPREPLRLTDAEQTIANGTFRLVPDATTGEQVLEGRRGSDWLPLYSFDGAHVTDGEVAAANHVTATWSQTPFASTLAVAGFDGDIRLGLRDRALTEDGPDGTNKGTLDRPEDMARLFARLRLIVPQDMQRRIWARLTGG